MKSLLFTPRKLSWIASLRIGAKCQTRRLNGLEEINRCPDEWIFKEILSNGSFWFQSPQKLGGRPRAALFNIYVKPRLHHGETVCLKEAHYRFGNWRLSGLTETGRPEWEFVPVDNAAVYFAENPPSEVARFANHDFEKPAWYKRSPLFLPERFARQFALVESVRAERVKSISPADVEAEGTWEWLEWYAPGHRPMSHVEAYCALLDWTHGKAITASNPWDFAYCLELVEGPKHV